MLGSSLIHRVIIALRLLGLSYEYQPLSVFCNFRAFSLFNPMIKAPALVPDDDAMLVNSNLTFDCPECLVGRERSLLLQRPQIHTRVLSLIGAALVVYEKSIQICYELNLRPKEYRHSPWLERVKE